MMSKTGIIISVIAISFSLHVFADEIAINSNDDSAGYIEGWVTFNNKPLADHILHLCHDTGDSLRSMPNTKVKTDPNGHYGFINVPDGRYAVYASCGDNPGFFNRFKRIEIEDGSAVKAEEIKQGAILKPVYPLINSVITSPEFEWLQLDGTVEYHLKLWQQDAAKIHWSCRTTDSFIIPRADEFALEPGKTYRWSLRALNDSGELLGQTPGCGSPPWTFTIAKKYVQVEEPEVQYKTDGSKTIDLPFKTRVNLGDFDIEYDSIYGRRVWFKQSNDSFVYIWGTRQNQLNRFPGYETRIVDASFDRLTIEVKETAQRTYYGYGIYYDFRKGERIDFPNGRSLEFRNISEHKGTLFAEVQISRAAERETLYLTSLMEYKLGFVDVQISSEIDESLVIQCRDPRRAIFHCGGKGSSEPAQ